MIAQRTARWDQRGQGQSVGTHHPFQARWREAKLVLQRRKRDAHDHDIQHHHDLSRARRRDGKPLPGPCTQSHDPSLPCLTGRHTVTAHSQGPYLDDLRAAARAVDAATAAQSRRLAPQKRAIPSECACLDHRAPCVNAGMTCCGHLSWDVSALGRDPPSR